VKILVLASKHVRELLTYTECADVMREALAGLARGQIQQPLRTVVRPREAAGFMGLMPSYSPEAGYGLKALVITPGNPAIGKDAHQGGVLLSDVRTGEPLALINASAITEVRTAAVSAVATDLLARPGAAELAVIGHHGSLSDADLSYATLGSYATRHEISIDGPLREYYLRGAGDTPDEADWRTEIGWPIFRADASRAYG